MSIGSISSSQSGNAPSSEANEETKLERFRPAALFAPTRLDALINGQRAMQRTPRHRWEVPPYFVETGMQDTMIAAPVELPSPTQVAPSQPSVPAPSQGSLSQQVTPVAPWPANAFEKEQSPQPMDIGSPSQEGPSYLLSQ